MNFEENFGIGINVGNGCSEGGNLIIALGYLNDDGPFDQGRALLVRFEIEENIVKCPADMTGDGILNFFDVSVFLTAFSSQNPIADFTGDGIYNFFDVSAFLTSFSAGCP